MTESYLRRVAVATAIVMVIGGGLNLWAVIAFPTLDMRDSGPVWIGVTGGLVGVASLWAFLMQAPLTVRLVLSPVGLAAGWWICFGGASVANGTFDQSAIRWAKYTVTDHWHGGKVSVVTLRRTGDDGPLWLQFREDRTTAGAPVGTPISVPVRDGALGIAWRPGPAVAGRP